MTTPSSIHYGEQNRTFLLLSTSFYAFRVLLDGEVLHAGSGALPPGEISPLLGDLGVYEEPDYVWEFQATRWELPTFGDVNYHDVALKVAFPLVVGEIAESEPANLPVRDLRLRYRSHEIRPTCKPRFRPRIINRRQLKAHSDFVRTEFVRTDFVRNASPSALEL